MLCQAVATCYVALNALILTCGDGVGLHMQVRFSLRGIRRRGPTPRSQDWELYVRPGAYRVVYIEGGSILTVSIQAI